MDNYAPNSHRFREEKNAEPEKKEIKKVVTGKARVRKNEVRKFTDIFISEDIDNVKSYIFMDVLVPAIKKAVSDIVTDGIDMILYGGSGKGKRRNRESYVSYRSYSDPRERERLREPRARSRFDYDDIIFDTYGEADAVLEQMREVIDQYGVVTVADLYDMADLSQPYTSNKYGWTSIRTAEVVRTRDGGYIIKLPRAMPID